MARSSRCALLSLALLVPAVAVAQPKPPPAPPCAKRAPPAIARIAEALASDLAGAPAGLVVAAPLSSDVGAPRGAELAAAVALQIAGRRGAGNHAHPKPLALGDARAAARTERALIVVTPVIAAGQLRVAADVFPVPRTVWARARDPEPGPLAHAFVQAPLDAELRGYLAPVPALQPVVVRAKNFEGDVVALACGDLDGDGAPEIVSVSRRRVTTLRLAGGKVAIVASRSWPDLVPVSPAPLREPIAFATLLTRDGLADAEGAPALLVDVASTDRARSVRLDPKLRVVATLGGLAVPDGDATACTRFGGLTVTGPLAACGPSDPPPLAASVGGRYDAFASATLVKPDGRAFAVWAGREDGVVEVRDDGGRKITFEGGGAQLAVGDLDEDGAPEVLASLDVASPADDAVVVRTWSDRLVERTRLPAAAGVHALAVCPPDGPGRAPFVVATADEIWVVR